MRNSTMQGMAGSSQLEAPGERILAKLQRLAEASDEPGRLTRLYLSPAHRCAIDLVRGWMIEAGLQPRLDATGSLIGRYEAASEGAPALLVGSHIDTVRDAGMFDGNLGVLTALEVVAQLNAAGRRFPFAIEVVAFGDEEGVRFPSTLGGSRAMAGRFDPALLAETDADGISRRAALQTFGCNPDAIAEARCPSGTLGYIEVHIEQGPVLEAEDFALGIVTGIAGASRGTVEVRGDAGHAGTVPMALRRDALAAAAEMILAVEQRARAAAEIVATVGRLDVTGGAVNTVPGRVTFTLDVRAFADEHREAVLADIRTDIAACAAARGVEARVDLTYDAPAARCDPDLAEGLAQAVLRCGGKVRRLPSGAGHDGMAFRGVLPFAMLFVRCRGGVSHNPAEFVAVPDIAAAAEVLRDFIEHFGPETSGEPR